MYETTLFSCFLFVISCRKEREANVRLGRPRSSKLLASNEMQIMMKMTIIMSPSPSPSPTPLS